MFRIKKETQYIVDKTIFIRYNTGDAALCGPSPVCLLFVSFFIISKKQICKHIVINTILFLTLLSFSFATTITFDRATNLQSYYIQKNKIVYFIESISFTTKKYSIDKISLTNYISTFQDKFPNNIFINPSYPFLHKETSPDVLSTYFNLQKEKPNFVFIIVEGLGREFSGNNSLLPSATPFLDSLSIQGLSWNNCFSTSQRTICAVTSQQYEYKSFFSFFKILSILFVWNCVISFVSSKSICSFVG